jgi:hypothetical protein
LQVFYFLINNKINIKNKIPCHKNRKSKNTHRVAFLHLYYQTQKQKAKTDCQDTKFPVHVNTKKMTASMTNYQFDHLISKFFYKDKKLRFQIVFSNQSEERLYQEFEEYSDYKTEFNRLLKLKSTQ